MNRCFRNKAKRRTQNRRRDIEMLEDSFDRQDDGIELLEEQGRWQARDVRYVAGKWEQVRKEIPKFELVDFKLEQEGAANPYLKTVIRVPRTKFEKPVPLGTVSHTYCLAQHSEVAEMCVDGIRQADIDIDNLKCELGLTELGEWMNLRIYFPDTFNHTPKDGQSLGLRLECFNSVDASSRLVVLLGWLRFVCSNGLVIGETKAELKDIHNKHMKLEKITGIVAKGLSYVNGDKDRIACWEDQPVNQKKFLSWVDETLAEKWNKKAACRVFHICDCGKDIKIADPFAPGTASQKPVAFLEPVPGSPPKANNLYDVSQALSWVASGRNNPEERLEWQSAIPKLIQALAVTA